MATSTVSAVLRIGLVRLSRPARVLVALSRRWIDSIPTAPIGADPAEEELRSWVERRFANDGPECLAQGLANLVDDLIDDGLRALLAEGWGKEIRYLSALLTAIELPRLSDPDPAAALLFDALNGAMLRGAVGSKSALSTRVLGALIEEWK